MSHINVTARYADEKKQDGLIVVSDVSPGEKVYAIVNRYEQIGPNDPCPTCCHERATSMSRARVEEQFVKRIVLTWGSDKPQTSVYLDDDPEVRAVSEEDLFLDKKEAEEEAGRRNRKDDERRRKVLEANAERAKKK
jgi:hypothetical protein